MTEKEAIALYHAERRKRVQRGLPVRMTPYHRKRLSKSRKPGRHRLHMVPTKDLPQYLKAARREYEKETTRVHAIVVGRRSYTPRQRAQDDI